MINDTIEMATSAAVGENLAGIMTMVMMTVTMVVIYVNLADRAFSLIHWIPERVTRWAGIESSGLAEDRDESATRAVAHAGATGRMEQAVHAMKTQGAKGTQEQKNAKDDGQNQGDRNNTGTR